MVIWIRTLTMDFKMVCSHYSIPRGRRSPPKNNGAASEFGPGVCLVHWIIWKPIPTLMQKKSSYSVIPDWEKLRCGQVRSMSVLQGSYPMIHDVVEPH